MKSNICTRMGDGGKITMPPEELLDDLWAGTQDAAERASIPKLTSDEIEHLFEIICEPGRMVGVTPGKEVIVTDDGGGYQFWAGQGDCAVGIPLSRMQSILVYERGCAADTASLAHIDYSYKQVKPIIDYEAYDYHSISSNTTIPLFYGSQPNMGIYYRPDGPFDNPAELLPMGKIPEALQAQVDAATQMKGDILYIGEKLNQVGCEGMNFDTSGSGGDAEFWAVLESVKELKEIAPQMAIEVGMSSEFVMGMHGDISFDSKRLAGLYPHEQVKVVETAGADIFGPAINVNTSESMPWNLARVVTMIKETTRLANIPVHANVGMGVGGIPMFDVPPIDCVSRASKALVEIGKADGL